MDHILQKVVGKNMISMMDGFSGYNQVTMHLDDGEKTTVTTPWGDFMYDKMPFWPDKCERKFSDIHGHCFCG
jgi:hypothetical protein